MEEIKFAKGSVPVRVAARVYGRDSAWIRAGIIGGWLPIGKARETGQSSRTSSRWTRGMGGFPTTSPRSSCMRRRDMCGMARKRKFTGVFCASELSE